MNKRISEKISDNIGKIKILFCRELEDKYLESLLKILPLSVNNRCASFKKSSLKLEYAVSRVLLSKLLDIEPQILENIQKSSNRKPYLQGYPDFSITHTENFVAVAVISHSGKVGIDAESIRCIDFDDFTSYFTQDETQFINLNSPVNFFRLWTAKEAVMKASGTGLREPFSDAVVNSDYVEYDGIRWYLYQLEFGGVLVSVCSNIFCEVDFEMFDLKCLMYPPLRL